MGHISGRGRFLDGGTLSRWFRRIRAWDRHSAGWRSEGGDGWLVDQAAVWRSWVAAHEGDVEEALGGLLLILDEADLVDLGVVNPGLRRTS